MNTSQISEVLEIFYNNADARIRDKIFMGTPYILISIYLFYVLFTANFLPKFMENRKPLNYDVLMSSLDAILCVVASYFFLHALVGWMYFYNWTCQPIDRSDIWLSNNELRLTHAFLVSKFLYILQSIVLVICKKDSPFAAYLLYHHTLFPIMLWFGINFYPGGHATFVGLINSFVHVNTTVMRFMAIKFPKSGFRTYQRLIHVCLNVFQYIAVFCHSSLLFFLHDCEVPKILGAYEIVCATIIAVFYKKFVINAKNNRSVVKQFDDNEKF
ncbi:unnamed protein product [Chironomus riparius]|uniref:Elongation of very long chain fatty acids protein n=1 Tax=Chironomus riparius TaxID=315576 RepID=A0A9N9WS17_9DIPT|nr:unnamed protein product [Chironomus riparius]